MKLGLAIRMPDLPKRALARAASNGWIPLHAGPKKLDIPGATVALVGPGGYVELVGKARALEGPREVRLLDGQYRENGYRFLLSRLASPRGWRRLEINWRAVGQFRYFNASNWKAAIVGEPVDRRSGSYLEYSGREVLLPLPIKAYAGGIPGVPRNAPEARLVRDYVEWIGSGKVFAHHYIRSAGLYEDLFDLRHWRLIEAKIKADRSTVRTAVGQLLDYKRFHPRKPSLGILLGEKPADGIVGRLRYYKITALWRTPAGRFGDSVEGYWTRYRKMMG